MQLIHCSDIHFPMILDGRKSIDIGSLVKFANDQNLDALVSTGDNSETWFLADKLGPQAQNVWQAIQSRDNQTLEQETNQPEYMQLYQEISLQQYDQLKDILAQFDGQVVYGAGNHDDAFLYHSWQDFDCYEDQPVDVSGLKIFGVHNSVPTTPFTPSHFQIKPEDYTQEELDSMGVTQEVNPHQLPSYRRLASAQYDILAMHEGPQVDEAQELKGFRKTLGLDAYIKDHQPKVILCGHVHNAIAYKLKNGTLVFRSSPTCSFQLDFEERTKKLDSFRPVYLPFSKN